MGMIRDQQELDALRKLVCRNLVNPDKSCKSCQADAPLTGRPDCLSRRFLLTKLRLRRSAG